MIVEFITISTPGRGYFKDRGSKFIGIAHHVEGEDEVKVVLDTLKKEFHDARHHCYAYVLGAERTVFRANDDGEPNHSAGDPILGQINSNELTNILVVVVRYFGGTKLGVSGLIHAYRSAAKAAIDDAIRLKVALTKNLLLTYPYASTNVAMRLVDDHELEIMEQSFTSICLLKVKVKVVWADQLLNKIKHLQDVGVDIQVSLV